MNATPNVRVKGTEPYDYMVKLLILGDSAVGKSSFMNKFCESSFNINHIATIGVDFKYKSIECEGKRIKLQIWDTAGQEKFRSIVQTYYKGAVGIVLMYSVNDRKSFQNIESWMKQISNHAPAGVVVVLVGNKCDLVDRVVEYSEGKRVADLHNVNFFETSAKDGTHVQEVFYDLAREIKSKVSDDPTILNEKVVASTQQTTGAAIKLDPQVHYSQDAKKSKPAVNNTSGGCKC